MNEFKASEIIEWHQSQGGAGINPAGHACRLLREVVELCVASGASTQQIQTAVEAEIMKAIMREELGKKNEDDMHEEFVDVYILMSVFQSYFLNWYKTIDWLDSKIQACKARLWEADADGVLWRPGTSGAPTAGVTTGDGESS
jgi:hypothetical protein